MSGNRKEEKHRKNRKNHRMRKRIALTGMLLILAAFVVIGIGILLKSDHGLNQKGTSFSDTAEGGTVQSEEMSANRDTGENDEEGETASLAAKNSDGSAASGSTDPAGQTQNANEGAGIVETDSQSRQIEELIAAMPLEKKVDQLFIVTPDQLTGVDGTVRAGTTFQKAASAHPVGGYIFFENNLNSPDQTRELLSGIKSIYEQNGDPQPLLTVDEEGGTVTRIAKNSAFGVSDVGNMRDIGATGDPNRAAEAGDTIGSYLEDLGFTTDFAPVADVLTNPENTVVAKRSFGSDPNLVTSMVQAECTALLQHDICPVLKHFPGHGATKGDTHEGYAYTSKTLDELMQAELVPFENADAFAPMIMAAHISLPNVTGDDTPASLSGTMITDVLRNKLGYQGVVITDALNMGAIVNEYGASKAPVLAMEAGCDLLLMPADLSRARQGILDAIKDGTLTEERINESLRRILRLKVQ